MTNNKKSPELIQLLIKVKLKYIFHLLIDNINSETYIEHSKKHYLLILIH